MQEKSDITIAITGDTSVLSANFNPPIYLDDEKEYYLGFADFETFMTIPNIENVNNKLYIGDKIITIPEGTYDLFDFEKYIHDAIANTFQNENINLSLISNTNTLKSSIYYSKVIDFEKHDLIGEMLGFKP